MLPEFCVIELINKVDVNYNSRIYDKGVRKIVSINKELRSYWVVNTQDTIYMDDAKEIYKIKFEKLNSNLKG